MPRRTPLVHIAALLVILAGCGTPAAPTTAPAPTSAAQAATATSQTPPATSQAPVATSPAPAAATPTPSPAAPAGDPYPHVGAQGGPLAPPTATPAFPETQITADNVSQLRLLRTVGSGQALGAAIAPDNSVLAIATTGGMVYIALPSFEHLRFDPFEHGVTGVAWSADGLELDLITGYKMAPQLLERRRFADNALLGNGTPNFTQRGAPVISPSGAYEARFNLPDASPTPGVEIIETASGGQIYQDSETDSISFSADSTLAALVSYQGLVRVLNLATLEMQTVMAPGFWSATFSPDGQTLVAAGRDLYVIDVVSGGQRFERIPIPDVTGNAALMSSQQRARFSPDGALLTIDGAYSIFEGTMRLGTAWRTGASYAQEWSIDLPGQGITNYETYAAAISPAAANGAVTSDGTTLEIYEDALVKHTIALETPATALEFSPDGALLAVGDALGGTRLIQVSDGTEAATFGDGAKITAYGFSPDGALLGVQLDDGAIKSWNLTTAQPVSAIAAAPPASQVIGAPIASRFTFSSDGELALVGTAGGVNVHRVGDGQLLHTVPVTADAIAIGPRRRALAILHDGYIQLWGIQ